MNRAKELLNMTEKVAKYSGEGNEITLKGFDQRYADQSGLNILHKLVRFPELADMKSKFKITVEVK